MSEGLVDHTLESKEVDNAKTEDVELKKKAWFHVLANIDV